MPSEPSLDPTTPLCTALPVRCTISSRTGSTDDTCSRNAHSCSVDRCRASTCSCGRRRCPAKLHHPLRGATTPIVRYLEMAVERRLELTFALTQDDMGYSQPSAVSDRSGFAGDNGTIATPNLDKFAAEGVAFTSWYSAFHVCSPSRASMMTGRLSVRTGIGFVGAGSNGVFTSESIGCLPANETTIAEAVSRVGYRSIMVGKWQCAYLSQLHILLRRSLNHLSPIEPPQVA